MTTQTTPHPATARALGGLPDPASRPDFYAGVAVKRGLAWLVDVILIGVMAILLLPLTAFTAVFFFPAWMLLAGFAYRWWTISGASATWGMRLFGIEFRDHDGRRFDSATAFWHTAGYTASVALAPAQLISAVMMLATPRGQGLTDTILGSTAINRPL